MAEHSAKQPQQNGKAQDRVEQPEGANPAPETEPQTPPSKESPTPALAPSPDSAPDDDHLDLKFHPVTELFPLLEGKAYEEFKEDIRVRGQLVPILTHDGQGIDGRNRYRAYKDLGIKPVLKEWTGEGSLVGTVLSLNYRRRHLDTSQRSMVAAQAKELFEAEAKERMLAGKAADPTPRAEEGSSGEAAAQAAKALGVGRDSVYKAQRARKEGVPELQEAVQKGQVTVVPSSTFRRPRRKALIRHEVRRQPLERSSRAAV